MERRIRRAENEKNFMINKFILSMIFGVGAVYLFLLFKIVLFKYVRLSSIVSGDIDTELRVVNLIPFNDVKEILKYDGIFGVIKNYIGNIGVFIPLGIILPLLFHEIKEKTVVAIGFCLSLFFEIVQYILCLGATDINDLLMNTFGTLVGLLIYKIVNGKGKNIVKVRVKGLVVLCCLGILGITAVYQIHPTAIVKQKNETINKEIISHLSEIPDKTGVAIEINKDKICMNVDNETDEGEFEYKKEEYTITKDTKYYCHEIKGTYNKSGNVTKVTGIYSEIDLNRVISEIKSKGSVFADAWLDDGNNLKAIMITKHIKPDENE